LNLRGARTSLNQAQYATQLTPAPAPLTTTDKGRLADYATAIGERLTTLNREIVGLTLPVVALGSQGLQVAGASLRDGYVTLDARIPR
jgi:hypothetical protein